MQWAKNNHTPEQSKPTHNNKFIYTYALGEFGFTFFLFFVSYYLMVFMTDVLALPTALAAILYTVIQWFEGITMVLAGIIIDRAKPKSGRFRPFIVVGSIVCLIGTTIFFTGFGLPTWASTTVFAVFYLIAYTGYNFMWVGYRTLLGPISRNPQDTISLTTASSQMGSVAGLCFSFISVRIFSAMPTQQAGFSASAFIYGLIMVIGMVSVSMASKQFDNQKSPSYGGSYPNASLKDMLKVFKKPVVIFFLAVTFRESVSTIVPTLLVFYFTYVMGDSALISQYITITTLSSLLGYFIARRLANKFGKKRMYITASIFSCACIISVNLIGNSIVAFMCLMAINSFCSIFSGAMIPAFINEIADYNEQTNGIHARAFTFSLGGTAIRTSSIVGGALASFGLAAIGYQSSQPVTNAIASGITWIMTYGSAIVILISVFIFMFYKLDNTNNY